MVTDTRDRILSRLRASRPTFEPRQRETPATEPAMPLNERIDRFRERMQAVRAEVYLVSPDRWTEQLQVICRDKGISNLLYAPDGEIGAPLQRAWANNDSLPSLINHSGDFDQWKEDIFFRVDAAITGCRAGIAETGSLVLWPTAEEPRTYSLVPPLHIAVLDAQRLYTSFAELIAAENWSEGMPTNALLISGPSKTADIEQTLAYGIHGPTDLTVLLRTAHLEGGI